MKNLLFICVAIVIAAVRAEYGIATISGYPGLDNDLANAAGTIVVEETSDGVAITGTLMGLEASTTAQVYIHEGFSVSAWCLCAAQLAP